MVKIIDNKLHMDGCVFLKSKTRNGRIYWDCRKVRGGECRARAVTAEALSPEGEVIFYKRPKIEEHTHVGNEEECLADNLRSSLKRKAEDNPERPPSAILREELPGVPEGVLCQLPERVNLCKAMRRRRQRNLPPNPKSLLDLGELPDMYQRTLLDEKFLIFDSLGNEQLGRVLVFSTRENLQQLAQINTWFLDGKFKVSE